ncbi:hypothetical protein WA026_000695 [Henosepilachna vigintioctopunctata]|uniref:Uncharacterized protein n=1 Tax=Henosepilachna vigintioctopunctata TaxID=420089 RepID=A0AAW1UYG3_9CUCU
MTNDDNRENAPPPQDGRGSGRGSGGYDKAMVNDEVVAMTTPATGQARQRTGGSGGGGLPDGRPSRNLKRMYKRRFGSCRRRCGTADTYL